MNTSKKKILKIYFFLFFILILLLFFYFITNKIDEEKQIAKTPITINLLTSVHPNLPWNFKPIEPKIIVKPGDVTTVEYIVENLDTKKTTGIATFVYFPHQFGTYISKINCFCYDARTLEPKEKGKFSLILLIDPAVSKDSKTKDIKEVTIQFTFFDYEEYKEKKS